MTAPTEEGIVPTELDILCGKTKQIISHPGTIRYQRVVESYTQRYINADSKFDKMSVTKNLYDYLKTTSRFLKYNDKTQCWEEITALAARDKVGHALRFAVNNINSEKKRMKSKRGHRRVGSDFSAGSLASINSAISTNTNQTANTATSDGGPMVQNLMQALSSNFNLAELQEAPTINSEQLHPLRAGSTTTIPEQPLRTDHPMVGGAISTIDENPRLGITTIDEHPLRRRNHNGGNPLLGGGTMLEHPNPLRESNRGHVRRSSYNERPPICSRPVHRTRHTRHLSYDPSLWTQPSMGVAATPSLNVGMANIPNNNSPPSSSAHSSSAPSDHQPIFHRKISDEDLDFLTRINESNNRNETDFVASFSMSAPPITEVVTTPQQQKQFDGAFNQDFLSMLQEPIYEFDVEEHDDANEDLY